MVIKGDEQMVINHFGVTFRRHSRFSRPLHGFTLVELLVVIAIIGTLVALLLPAVQAAREAARRTQCLNNIKNVGLAVLNFHDTFGYFPPAMEYSEETIKSGSDIGSITDFGPNWVILILPFLEQQPLSDLFVFKDPSGADVYVSDPLNRVPRGAQITTMRCPTDPATEPFGVEGTAIGDNWARGNYAANSSLLYLRLENLSMSPYPRADFYGGKFGIGSWWNDREWTRGVMGCNLTTSIRQITDGTTNTVMLAEVRAGLNVRDRRGVWAMGTVGASSIWGHAIGDSTGVNSCNPYADNIPDSNNIRKLTDNGTLLQECMSSGSGALQAVPRSLHPGGLHVCFADASARFISENINIGNCGVAPSSWINRSCIGTWHYLTASRDEFVVDSSSF